MEIRRATAADVPVVEKLWLAFTAEVPEPTHIVVEEAAELVEVRGIVESELAFLAEEDGEALALALITRESPTLAQLTDLYVVPEARRRGIAAALIREVVSQLEDDGVEHLQLEVLSRQRRGAVGVPGLGVRRHTLALVAPVDVARAAGAGNPCRLVRIAPRPDRRRRCRRTGSDRVRAARRLRGNPIEGPRNGWTTVYDEAIDRDPTALVRFARELSSRLGAVVIALSLEFDKVVRLVALDRGGIVDEYLSVPEFYGPLPPGDVIGLAANPTVLHRLTGADPASVREVARTAASASELPPAQELIVRIAGALGLEGAERGYA